MTDRNQVDDCSSVWPRLSPKTKSMSDRGERQTATGSPSKTWVGKNLPLRVVMGVVAAIAAHFIEIGIFSLGWTPCCSLDFEH